MTDNPKPIEWEIRDLLDGRFGIFRNGLCLRVFRTHAEAAEWWKNLFGSESVVACDSLGRAIRKLD